MKPRLERQLKDKESEDSISIDFNVMSVSSCKMVSGSQEMRGGRDEDVS